MTENIRFLPLAELYQETCGGERDLSLAALCTHYKLSLPDGNWREVSFART